MFRTGNESKHKNTSLYLRIKSLHLEVMDSDCKVKFEDPNQALNLRIMIGISIGRTFGWQANMFYCLGQNPAA